MEAPEVADEWKVNSPGQTRPLLGPSKSLSGREFSARPEVLGELQMAEQWSPNVLKHASSFQDIFSSDYVHLCKSYSWSDIEVIKYQLLT